MTDGRVGKHDVSYPRYISGERNGPPEDCGGIPGFYELQSHSRGSGAVVARGRSKQHLLIVCIELPDGEAAAAREPAERVGEPNGQAGEIIESEEVAAVG